MGPLQMSDLAGNDIGYSIRRDMGLHEPATTPFPDDGTGGIADKLVEMGRLGQKTKAGWYDYSAGKAPVDDPVVTALIDAHCAGASLARRDVSAEEVLDRCMLPLVNEGFKILSEGIAQRESDLDMVYLYGYGFPRYKGGPMYWARHIRPGLPKLLADLGSTRGHPTVSHWKPAELLRSEVGS